MRDNTSLLDGSSFSLTCVKILPENSPVPTESSSTDVMVVQTTEDGAADNGAGTLNIAPGRCILSQR